MSNEIPNYPLLGEMAGHQSHRAGRSICYLEIGVCEGGSAEAVLSSQRVRLAVLVDPWTEAYGGSNRGNARHVIERLGQWMERTVIITGSSHDILPRLDAQFDLIYVDGDHSEPGVLKDLEDSLRLLAPRGVMMVDDVDHKDHPYIRKIVEDFSAKNDLDLTFHNVHTGMAQLARKA